MTIVSITMMITTIGITMIIVSIVVASHSTVTFDANSLTEPNRNDSVGKCPNECIHGFCSETPQYKCVCTLGWSGDDCTVNCGCHNHSNCANGIGKCDDCRHWTEGQYCERCKNGSYGNATNAIGCHKCDCNGHGDESRNLCDSMTGQCFCLHNTEGFNCETCKTGFYGDPRNGGNCYIECNARSVITDATDGFFGSKIGYISNNAQTYCLWIFTVYDAINSTNLYLLTRNSIESSHPSSLLLKISRNMIVECPYNHIQIYDGVPEFVALGALRKKLGYYCGVNLSEDIVLVAHSGFITVYFERHDPSQGFNASYQRLDCPGSCTTVTNRICVNGNCECEKNFSGHECNTNACPNNCYAEQNQGSCDVMNGRCVCMPKYGGRDCSQIISPNKLIWTTYFDAEAVESYLPTLGAYIPRMGHTLDSTDNSLWLYAGYSSSRGQISDIFRFNLISQRWEEIKPLRKRDGVPQARHFHATASIGNLIFLYGGLSNINGVLGDFWCFKTAEQSWIKLSTSADMPPLAGHTLTAINNSKLLLIGGFSPSYGFLEKHYEYDIIDNHWTISNAKGASPTGIYGHTAVYHALSMSVYVYGGIIYDIDRTIISGDLYALHLSTNLWFRLPLDDQINSIDSRPFPRYFHAAVTTENYMLIIGGRSNESDNNLIRDIYAYSYRCNRWTSFEMEGIGDPPPPAVGLAATIQDHNLYVFGGLNGQTRGRLSRLILPKDLCQLFSHSRLICLSHLDCSYCAVYENGVNRTFCYSQEFSVPQSCSNPKGASEMVQGIPCTVELLEKRNCKQYKSCVDCVAVWPIYASAKQGCQWCSNCNNGRCIPTGVSCERDTDSCNIPQRVVTLPHMCPLRSCLATDCDKCTVNNICMWTRHVIRSSEFVHTLNIKPIFDWTCVMKILQDSSTFPVESMPPLSCPPRCHQHTNCTTCLESAGGDGGSHECSWTDATNECLSPSYVRLRCESGLCGSVVLQGSRAQCPIQCSQFTQSAHCLSRPNCGWCLFSGPKVNGRGLCMDGGLFGPTGGICKHGNIVIFGVQLSSEVSQWIAQSEGPPKWTYLERPPEDECLNGHHTCDERHEECVDLADGFMCRCKPGFVIDGTQCKPVCNNGCVFGSCIAPDICQCNFGYIGNDCSIACDCNGHSNCAGINRLSDCLECQNNTQGPQCQKCKPLYVGNAINGGKCISCKVYCNNHSEICLSPDVINNTNTMTLDQISSVEDLTDIVHEGSMTEAICIKCQHNTYGKRCDECIPGYFKITDNIRDGCKPCHCHGHGDMCDPLNGENCNCQNNTENDRQCNQKNKNLNNPCWQLQCSKCKEYFLGVPTNGHHCYRHMFLEKDYCLDPNTQEECIRQPNPLLYGRTVFFAVQPRYMNVDIRVIVDITSGGVEFFLSSKEDIFVIDVNGSNGMHNVWLDKRYANDVKVNDVNDFDDILFKKEHLTNESSYGFLTSFINPSPHIGPALKLRHHNAFGLIYYLTVTDPNEFLVIRGLRNRLVITIPQEVYDLRSTRFYMILRSVGNGTMNGSTFGNLFFRQDQSRIDLFVFFSVFFSCFFLFLAACVVIWKVKQGFDLRRARRLHAAEMKHMASRPFAVILAYIDPYSDPYDFEFALSSPAHHIHNVKRKGFRSKGSSKDSPKITKDHEVAERYLIRPVAVEPTSDSLSAVVTTLISLPGGTTAPIRMSLASALISVRGSHHILNYHHCNSSNNVSSMGVGVWRNAMRRRAF